MKRGKQHAQYPRPGKPEKSYKVDAAGGAVNVTRKMIVNDDLPQMQAMVGKLRGAHVDRAWIDEAEIGPVQLGFLGGKDDPELLVKEDRQVNNVFVGDRISWKVAHEYHGTVLDTSTRWQRFRRRASSRFWKFWHKLYYLFSRSWRVGMAVLSCVVLLYAGRLDLMTGFALGGLVMVLAGTKGLANTFGSPIVGDFKTQQRIIFDGLGGRPCVVDSPGVKRDLETRRLLEDSMNRALLDTSEESLSYS